ncbi:hypothetical protein PO185_02050 [Limosilactobacillus mucosae]|uniref:hypothetical protein n=1 Tax=Limosilactobacillus mucosae TaxID=97478 RepID=UPI00233EA937|nr:hypothetical protein [Limosilactobacillus mucosae]MDC2844458.1 hypothetical protein [Limosilactobacillus mucosae]
MEKKSARNGILITILFIFLSVLFVYPLQKQGIIYRSDDLAYHINRITELIANFKNGNFYPYIYTFSFNKVGFPLGIFYPWLTLVPFALFSILLGSNILGIYAGFAFYTFLTLLFVYTCVRRFDRSRLQAVLTSVIYAFCTYRTIDAFTRFDLGEFLGMVFLPLCLYGFYAVMFGNKNDWPFLAFGMSFIILSHILSTFITTVFLAILFLIFIWNVSNKLETFKYLTVSAVVAFASSAIFLFPFLSQELFQQYSKPSVVDVYSNAATMDQMFLASLGNSMERYIVSGHTHNIGIVLLMVILFGIVVFKKFSTVTKVAYLIGLTSFVMATNLFPWSIIQNTFFSVIQYPSRVLTISSCCLSFVGGEEFKLIKQDLFNKSLSNRKTILITLVCIVLVVLPWYSGIIQLKRSSNTIVPNQPDWDIPNKPYVTDSQKYKGYSAWYLDQYTPKNTLPYFKQLNNHVAIIDGKKIKLKNIVAKPNAQIYINKNIKAGSSVDLPVALYKNLHVYQSGKEVKLINSKRNMIAFKAISSGSVIVKYVPSLIDKLGTVLSLATWLMAIVYATYTSLRKNLM